MLRFLCTAFQVLFYDLRYHLYCVFTHLSLVYGDNVGESRQVTVMRLRVVSSLLGASFLTGKLEYFSFIWLYMPV